ncbi:hypothetical protein O7634_03580 [Micromonospora sp. WMMD1120]|uniref:hypothetical protein n=1 Tax=Micromonospora sp. WMMD1120 TaxID=3016106 RepID=UPI002416A8B4|nr:hypothetical protein [Micromonospora sp. WMMD1120]MDG4805834.1 hypothetical protein [Micromonospora sp. WMMD1120]
MATESVADEPPTRPIDALLDDVFRGQERVDQGEIYRRAVAAGLPADLLTRVDSLPEGEYSVDEASDLLGGTLG